MGNCCICGKKMGMFEGSRIAVLNESMSSYYACGNCSLKLESLRQGSGEYISEIQEMISNTNDDKLKEYISGLYKKVNKKEIERINKEAEKKRQEEYIQAKKSEFKKIMDEKANGMLLTMGYNFEGYKITQYKDIISGECVLGTGFISELGASLSDLTGTRSGVFSDKLKEAKSQALFELQESCYLQGGNAIIGIDFDYITFANNMIGVIANGTAVVIEKLS